MKKLISNTSLLMASLLLSQYGHTACTLNSGFSTQNIDMNMGTIVIDPNLAVGAILKKGSFPIEYKSRFAHCNFRGGYTRGYLNQNTAVTAIPNTYATNVAGIGIRLYRDARDLSTYYPHTINLPGNANVSLFEGYFQVEIIKTAATTGTGALAEGIYSTYYVDGNPNTSILTSRLNANGITVINPTCGVDVNSKNISVNLDTVASAELTTVGSTAKERAFQINLNCNGGNYDKNQLIKMRFEYSPDADAGAQGVIQNMSGADYATGIGVQLLTNKPSQAAMNIRNGDAVEVGSTTLNSNTVLSLPLKARYYKTKQAVKAGLVYSQAYFTIEYN